MKSNSFDIKRLYKAVDACCGHQYAPCGACPLEENLDSDEYYCKDIWQQEVLSLLKQLLKKRITKMEFRCTDDETDDLGQINWTLDENGVWQNVIIVGKDAEEESDAS